MLSLIVWIPLAGAALLALGRRIPARMARWTWVGVTALDLALVVIVWVNYTSPRPGGLAFEEQVPWIPGLGTSYHLGIDGLSLPLLLMSNLVFLACAVYSLGQHDRPRSHAALFLFLQTTCLGVFAAQDLIVFFVFFDLSIVGMYFAIAGWGHGNAAASALRFFLYTFLGSLVLLLGFIGLYVASDPHTFDMVELVASAPLQGSGATGILVLLAVVIGLAIKTPTIPFHTWLPPAHTDASAAGSAVLAGVLLKLGAYGFVRIAMPMLPEAWRDLAWTIVAIGVISAIYGAFVALGQSDVKRMIAYTSVNHMGYVVMAVGVVGLAGGSDREAQRVAVTGAMAQMVAHGLIAAALFLTVGVLHDRRKSYEFDDYGGLAATAPRWATLFTLGAFASLGLPGFVGFVAELQIFSGSITLAPVTAVAVTGILITAGLFLRAVQLLGTGPTRGASVGFVDVHRRELVASGGLLLCAAVLGIFPRPLLDLIEPAAATVADLVNR